MKPVLAAAIIAILAVTNPVSAGKIAVDPNKAPLTAPSDAKEAPDPRLDQLVTYTATGKRLHTVLEEISKQTRVAVYSGKAPSDWQVRDLPVVVCVKDLPLGKLLRSIADATHLALTSNTVNNVKRYRIYRDYKRQKELDDYFRTLDESNKARLSAQWDAWLKLSRASDAEIEQAAKQSRGMLDPNDWQTLLPAAKSFAKVMSLLPSDSKDSFMAGRKVRLNPRTASPELAQALRAYYSDVWARMRSQLEEARAAGEPVSRTPLRELSENAMAKMDVIITNDINTGRAYVPASMRVIVDPNVPLTRFTRMASPEGNLAMTVLDDGIAPSSKSKQPSTDYAPFLTPFYPSTYKEADPAKFKFEKPKDSPTYAEILSMIAQRTGYSIVCEDFISHTEWSAPDIFEKDLTFAELLYTEGLFWMQRCGTRITNMDWHIDSNSRLLVGSDGSWYLEHHILAPERLITRLLQGVNGDGLEMDDAVLTLLLSTEQNFAWVEQHRDLGWRVLGLIPDRYRPLWKLYAALSPKDKAKAKSADGLALAGVSKDLVAAAFSESAVAVSADGTRGAMDALNNWVMSRPDLDDARDAWMFQKYPALSGDHPEDALADIDFAEMAQSMTEAFPDAKPMLTPPPTDPEVVSKLKMYLLKVDLSAQKHWNSTFKALGLTQSPHTYTLLFEGEGIRLDTGALRESYPVFSEKRQQQLREENSSRKRENSESTKGER